MIPIKNEKEIQLMRDACRIAATVLDRLCDCVEVGVTTYDLDQLGKQFIEEMGAKSACFNYKGGGVATRFPAYTCLSVNEEVIHGIGTLKCTLKEGDIISVDVSIVYKGFIGDNTRTVVLNPVSQEVMDLVDVTEKGMHAGIKQAKANNRVGDISHAIQQFVESRGFGIVRDFVGHGVGRSIHEDPQIPNFGRAKSGAKLKSGMTLAIEPMVNLGDYRVKYASDGWTAVTVDGKPSAHFEQTVLITDNDPEILTIPEK